MKAACCGDVRRNEHMLGQPSFLAISWVEVLELVTHGVEVQRIFARVLKAESYTTSPRCIAPKAIHVVAAVHLYGIGLHKQYLWRCNRAHTLKIARVNNLIEQEGTVWRHEHFVSMQDPLLKVNVDLNFGLRVAHANCISMIDAEALFEHVAVPTGRAKDVLAIL